MQECWKEYALNLVVQGTIMQGPQNQRVEIVMSLGNQRSLWVPKHTGILAPGSKVSWIRQKSEEGEETRAKAKNKV